jgi:hypothetical protein
MNRVYSARFPRFAAAASGPAEVNPAANTPRLAVLSGWSGSFPICFLFGEQGDVEGGEEMGSTRTTRSGRTSAVQAVQGPSYPLNCSEGKLEG